MFSFPFFRTQEEPSFLPPEAPGQVGEAPAITPRMEDFSAYRALVTGQSFEGNMPVTPFQ
jgi:hypothetical protein